MASYPEIKNCMHCREELVSFERHFHSNTKINITQCPKCTYRFTILMNDKIGERCLFVRSGDYRISLWKFINGIHQCNVDQIYLLEGVTYDASSIGFVAELTTIPGERASRVCTVKERVNFNFEDPAAFYKKVKMMVTFS